MTTPDARAVSLFMDGKIRINVWRHTILPLCCDYVKSWCLENEHKAAEALNKALMVELIEKDLHDLNETKQIVIHESQSVAPESKCGETWNVHNDGNCGRCSKSSYEGYYALWNTKTYLTERNNQFHVQVFFRHERIISTWTGSKDAAIAFLQTFFAGADLDGRCFDLRHQVKKAKTE